MKMMYSLLDKKDASELNAIKEKAQHFIANQEDY